MVEVQKHGFGFESWIRQEIFEITVEENYGRKWDVGPDGAKHSLLPKAMHGLPVSIKTCGWGGPVNLSDAIRQMTIDEDFVMIVGFWDQVSAGEKNFTAIRAARFKVADWKRLWRSYDLDSVLSLDRAIKNMDISSDKAHEIADNWKTKNKPKDDLCLRINPKIDSKKQRRIQCSLPFQAFWNHIGEVPKQALPQLFCGKRFPNPVKSEPRVLRKKSKD